MAVPRLPKITRYSAPCTGALYICLGHIAAQADVGESMSSGACLHSNNGNRQSPNWHSLTQLAGSLSSSPYGGFCIRAHNHRPQPVRWLIFLRTARARSDRRSDDSLTHQRTDARASMPLTRNETRIGSRQTDLNLGKRKRGGGKC